MSNRSLWNVRRRHEWLAMPLKGKPLKKRKRLRIGLEQARALLDTAIGQERAELFPDPGDEARMR